MDSANPQGGHGFGSVALKFYRVRGLLVRNWWILTLTIALGLAWKGCNAYKQPRLFESQVQLNIREAMSGGDDSAKYNVERDAFIATTLARLKSPAVINGAVEKLRLKRADLHSEVP